MDYFTLRRLFDNHVLDSTWEEEKHPRDTGGRFATKAMLEGNPHVDTSGLTEQEATEKIRAFSEIVKDTIGKNGFFVSKITHSGSRMGASSYMDVDDPDTGVKVNVRVSGHSKGAFNSQFVYDIGDKAEIENFIKMLEQYRTPDRVRKHKEFQSKVKRNSDIDRYQNELKQYKLHQHRLARADEKSFTGEPLSQTERKAVEYRSAGIFADPPKFPSDWFDSTSSTQTETHSTWEEDDHPRDRVGRFVGKLRLVARAAKLRRSFEQTEKAYGGKVAHEKAKAAGKTKLEYRQWVHVRTPEFKKRFGDWEANALHTFLNGKPVADVPENTAPHEGFAKLREWATDLFREQGGKALNPELGEVMLDNRAVRDSIAHGMNAMKADAFAAVKPVIEQGKVVLRGKSKDGIDSIYVAAPVKIGRTETVVVALIHATDNNRMYLHGVETKENLKTTRNSTTDTRSGSRSAANLEAVRSILQDTLSFNSDSVSKATDPDTGEPTADSLSRFDSTSYFSPNQIKSATGNSGAFSAKDIIMDSLTLDDATGSSVTAKPLSIMARLKLVGELGSIRNKTKNASSALARLKLSARGNQIRTDLSGTRTHPDKAVTEIKAAKVARSGVSALYPSGEERLTPTRRQKENDDAIDLLKTVRERNTPLIDEERATLARYTGNGGNLVNANGRKGSPYEYYTPKPIAEAANWRPRPIPSLTSWFSPFGLSFRRGRGLLQFHSLPIAVRSTDPPVAPTFVQNATGASDSCASHLKDRICIRQFSPFTQFSPDA